MNDLLSFDLHIFDLDDTLINTRRTYSNAQTVAVESVFPELNQQEKDSHTELLRWLCRIFGSGFPEQYINAFLVSLFGTTSDIQEKSAKMISTYKAAYWSGFGCLAGAVPYLEHLRSRGKALRLVSNGVFEAQMKKLRLTGLDRIFPKDACLISGQFAPECKKPSPYMIKSACEQSGASNRQAVFYGNTISDVLAGNLAGVATVFFGEPESMPADPPAIAKPDYTVLNWEGPFIQIKKTDY